MKKAECVYLPSISKVFVKRQFLNVFFFLHFKNKIFSKLEPFGIIPLCMLPHLFFIAVVCKRKFTFNIMNLKIPGLIFKRNSVKIVFINRFTYLYNNFYFKEYFMLYYTFLISNINLDKMD